jgi:hypothetical protein
MPLDKDTKGGAEFEEIARVIRMETKFIGGDEGTIKVIICDHRRG